MHEKIKSIVGECPAVIGKRRRARRIIRQNIWEQCSGYTLRLSRRVSASVLQCVCEGSKEASIVHWFASKVRISFFDKQDGLGRSRSAFHLDPPAVTIWRKSARP